MSARLRNLRDIAHSFALGPSYGWRLAPGSRHRRYSRSVLRRVAFIVFAQRIGLTLAQHWSQTEDGGSHRQDHALRAATDTAKVLEAIGNYAMLSEKLALF